MTSPSSTRDVIDVPRLPQPSMRFPAQVPREWAEQAVMLMVGMRHLLKDCAKGRAFQTRPAPVAVSPVVPQMQPRRSARTRPQGTTSPPAPATTRGQGTGRAPRPSTDAGRFEVVPQAASRQRPATEESQETEGSGEETEESSESRVLGATNSETASGSSGDGDGDGDSDSDESKSTEPEGQQQKRTRQG